MRLKEMVRAEQREGPVSGSSSPAEAPQRGATTPRIAVTLLADDRLTLEGARVVLGSVPELLLVQDDRRDTADVLLYFAADASDRVISAVEEYVRTNARLQIVLVLDRISESRLARVVGLGVANVLIREQCGFAQVARTVVAAREGHGNVPSYLLGPLLRRMREEEGDGGAAPHGLEPRELRVLGLLAEGLDTIQIAQRLNYSDRTIKTIIQRVISTLEARNRVHAVARAIRVGVI
ncbi:LuxR C-terminal-related transcriptional regulator [Streptomyces mirabilis]|uniref:helix-turn-helix transcriptional regulator n=1 Tax=Streptomyces mirabilis TaxID=68239 RepID=UPI003322CB5D